ncbi:DUF5946 family protein [Sinomicrobium oceani]|uniref:DUF5946 family protein n=1 Tax=Sinomicrobium oceani TaxID=1150368 RepID=UPI00227B44E5|nr:DUF5946 family protein [Sinomicrobium oceani]
MDREHGLLEQWHNKYLECLALEFNNPEYYEVHHLLVLTYMLQTDGYSDVHFDLAKELLELFLKGSVRPQKVKGQFGFPETDLNIQNTSGYRNFKKYRWNLDIMVIGTDRPEQYRKDVRAWAEEVLTVIETHTDGQ